MDSTPWVVPTPEVVLPLVEPVVPPLRDALRIASRAADEIEPDGPTRERSFWAHAARRKALGQLQVVEAKGWALVAGVANCGIHVVLGSLHKMRVLRALGDAPPPPGLNKARQLAFQQEPNGQGTLALSPDGLPTLSLIADWTMQDGEPVIHVSLPRKPWHITSNPALYWRECVTGSIADDLARLAFTGDTSEESLVTVELDTTELDESG
jgi:hypothetical protein